MSQKVTREVALTLKKGDVLYNNVIEFTLEDGTKEPATCVVTGKLKEHPVEEFLLPIKRRYGDGGTGSISKFGSDLWRTTPEKVVQRHVVRTRPAEAVQPASDADMEDEPVRRVRRTRVVQEEAAPVRRVRRSR